jgi:hypothetical protein
MAALCRMNRKPAPRQVPPEHWRHGLLRPTPASLRRRDASYLAQPARVQQLCCVRSFFRTQSVGCRDVTRDSTNRSVNRLRQSRRS